MTSTDKTGALARAAPAAPDARVLRMGRTGFALALIVSAVAISTGAAAAVDDGFLDTTLASRASGAAGPAADNSSEIPHISADGRYVAFQSDADNLDPDSNDIFTDVFVRDTASGTISLVSRASGAVGAVGDDHSQAEAISADGRYVAFSSFADNLDPDSNDTVVDLFVRDRVAGTTTLVSRATGVSGAVGDDDSFGASISADGRYVAFASDADSLDPDSNDSVRDVFVRDLVAETTTLVSRATGATGTVADGSTFSPPSISADGTWVAFESNADNLDADSNESVSDVFVRDLSSDTTTLVSRASGVTGAVGNGSSVIPAISSDGRYVTFESLAANLDSESDDTVRDVFVRDLNSQTTVLVSRAGGVGGAPANGESFESSISGDGRVAAFTSGATNLDSESNDAVEDIFARDLAAGTTTLVSRTAGAAGAPADDASRTAVVAAGGRYVAFASEADNLDPDSNDSVTDIFVRELFDPGQPPTPPTTTGTPLPPAGVPDLACAQLRKKLTKAKSKAKKRKLHRKLRRLEC